VLHQVFAVPFRWGFSGRTLTLMLSRLAGMLSLEALALIILTLNDDVALSIVGPFAVYFTDVAVGGVTYPLDLMVGGFEPDSGRASWKARTASEWKAIAEEFGVTDVLTYPDWELQLPVVARSGSFTLFEVPR